MFWRLLDDICSICLTQCSLFLQVVHPKSDSQRKSLLEAVKEILLFRSLDQEQLAEVLDAMFERKVNPEEYIIRQVS